MSTLYRFVFTLVFALFSLVLHAEPLDGEAVIADILARGEASVAAYDPAHSLAAASEFSALYFERFENLELDLALKDSNLKNELEVLFGALNGNAMRGVPKAQLEASWQELKPLLTRARTLYAESESASGGGTFLKALTILLREGVEAMLVVGALAAYLRRAGAADRVWVIYAGVAVAIPLSILTGWAVNNFLQATGAPLAVVEGVTMLAASTVLFYVSCWMFAKREAKRWEEWIARQMDAALGKGSLLALSGASCLAVYREGAETVLFYQALALQSPGQEPFLYAGLGVAALLLVVFFFLMRHAALRLPFKLFFGATSVLLYGLAVVFLGQAIVELQAAGWIASIYLSGFPHISWLGIAPTAQSLGAQTALLLLPLTWQLLRRRGANRQAR
ncbi:MAG: FTR1 family iron permease [Zoogloeaceae bacterium]|jgi:high-affinity iron transporter|nr:FTR1 family iron permease [Zoogloeaceae bacterium]